MGVSYMGVARRQLSVELKETFNLSAKISPAVGMSS